MNYTKLPLRIRNKNIETISVVLNTLDSILFPNIITICKVDLDRFRMINSIQNELGNGEVTNNDVYQYCISFEQNL